MRQPAPQPPPKNVIIEYERPRAVAIRQVIEEGVFRCDPATYHSQPHLTGGEVRFVDRITDLPIENSRVLAQLRLDDECKAAAADAANEALSDHQHVNINESACSSGNNNLDSVYEEIISSSHHQQHNHLHHQHHHLTSSSNNTNNNNWNYYASTNDLLNEIETASDTKTDISVSMGGRHHHHHYQETHRTSTKQQQQQHRRSGLFTSSCLESYGDIPVEYETITTSVPESLAVKIIAEARAAGAIANYGASSSSPAAATTMAQTSSVTTTTATTRLIEKSVSGDDESMAAIRRIKVIHHQQPQPQHQQQQDAVYRAHRTNGACDKQQQNK